MFIVFSFTSNSISELRSFQGHEQAAWCVDFVASKDLALSGGSGRDVLLWRPSSGEIIYSGSLPEKGFGIYDCCLTDHHAIVATLHGDKTVFAFSLQDGKCVGEIGPNEDLISTVVFDSYSKLLYTASFSGKVSAYELEGFKEVWCVNLKAKVKDLIIFENKLIALASTHLTQGEILSGKTSEVFIAVWHLFDHREVGRCTLKMKDKNYFIGRLFGIAARDDFLIISESNFLLVVVLTKEHNKSSCLIS